MKNRTEQRGFVWLSVLLMLTLVILMLIPHKSRPIPSDDEIAEVTALQREKNRDGSYCAETQPRKVKTSRRNSRPADENKGASPFKTGFANPSFEVHRHEYQTFVVNINTADTLDLQDLYGIGPYFARAIVKYRNLLGGYVCKEQLLEVYGMTDDRYESIAPHIGIDDRHIHKLNINKASYGDLRRHPYIDSHLAKAIVRLRSSGEKFHNADDLLKISIIDKETINKLSPYLDFGETDNSVNTVTHNDTLSQSRQAGPNT